MTANTLPAHLSTGLQRRPGFTASALAALAPLGAWWRARQAARQQRRRLSEDRQCLAEMNEHALADLGIGRDQIAHLTDPCAQR